MVIKSTVLAGLAATGLAWVSSGTGALAVEAKLGHLAPTGDPRHEVMLGFAQAIEEGTGGEVTVEVFPDSTLGKERELFEQAQAGITELALVGSVVANFYPAWSIIDMPFLWRDREHLVEFVNSDYAEQWSKDMAEETGVELLAFLERNPRILTTTTKPVRSVADLEGMKVRVPNVNVYTDTWRAFGVEPVPMPAADFYLALKLAGAVYLVWLGIGMFRTTGPVETSGPSPMPVRTPGTRRTFVRSILVQLLNPKVAIFYVAFLPQFTDPAAAMPIGLQFAILGIIVNLMFLAVDSTSVLLADRVRSALGRSRRTARLIGQIGGSLLVALGIRLAFERG